jgi:16S rRNA (guanine527-N7)-methyltransferase
LARRTAFLAEVVGELSLERVDIVRGRAEDVVTALRPADIVTARAVAPLDRLASWCLPLARPGGSVLAIKGSSAGAEIEEHRDAVRRAGGGDPTLRQCGARWLPEPVSVVEVRRSSAGGAGGGLRGPQGEASRAGLAGGTRGGKAGTRRPADFSNDTRGERRARRGDGGGHPRI